MKGLIHHARAPEEYAFHHIIRHIREGAGVKYAIQRFGYTSANYTI